jgi:hypothetical protein
MLEMTSQNMPNKNEHFFHVCMYSRVPYHATALDVLSVKYWTVVSVFVRRFVLLFVLPDAFFAVFSLSVESAFCFRLCDDE